MLAPSKIFVRNKSSCNNNSKKEKKKNTNWDLNNLAELKSRYEGTQLEKGEKNAESSKKKRFSYEFLSTKTEPPI